MSRDELVERVAEALWLQDWMNKTGLPAPISWGAMSFFNSEPFRVTSRAALAIIEPAVRDDVDNHARQDERQRCASLVDGWEPWRSDINPRIAAAIRAGAKT